MTRHDPLNILLVDDEPANLLALEAVLEPLGETLVRAQSGEEALKRILGNDFAVVLLDIRMPGLTGYDTARLIRDHPRCGQLPIIFITAAEDKRFPIEQAYALGAVDYMTKPIIPTVLRAKVAFFVELHRKTEELARIERAQHAAALSAKDEQIQLIMDNIRDYAFIVTDAEGRITEWQGGAECITGWTAEEAIGRSPAIIFSPEDRATECLEAEMSRAQDTGRAQDQRWHVRKDGSRFFADGIMVALRDPAGNLRGFAKIFRDATAQRLATEALRASEERYRTLFESIDEGFCIIEMIYDGRGQPEDYRFLETNPAFEKQTGLASAVGKSMRELAPDHDPHGFETYGRVAQTGEPKRFVEEAAAMGRWFDVYATPTGGPGSRKVALLFTDITERKRADEDIRQLAADLSEANRRKSEFLATLAHELRNPLAPIRAGIDFIKLSADNPQAVARVREMMERQLKHLVHLVDDLLDIARIDGGKLDLRQARVELKSIVASAVETTQPLVDAGRHHLSIDLPAEPVMLYADPTRISQVISNLLNNATRYTPNGGRIRLAAEAMGDEVLITVTDNGVGIPGDSLGVVFDMFTRVRHGADASRGGLGIGLSLVRRLVEMHGGTISAASQGIGKGSSFIVTLPLLREQDAALHSGDESLRPEHIPAPKALRILVADDNTDAADSLSVLLEAGGHAVRIARDGAQALEAALDFKPDVVFLDIGMPRMSGYEVAQRLSKTPGMDKVILVALTGWGTKDDQARSSAAGFHHHLTKPAGLNEINHLLRRLS